MTKISPGRIVELISASSSARDAPRLLHDVVAEQLVVGGMASDLDEASELAEPLLKRVRNLISQAQSDAEIAGKTWTLELFGSEDEYIRGSSFPDHSLSPREQLARANRAHSHALEDELRRLAPAEFEVACTAILRLMGCSQPRTSPLRDDGGLDFYGRLELAGRLDNQSPYGGIDRRVAVWLIGQAKHYPTRPIQTAHLRELVGSVELARTGGAIHIWEGLDLRPFDAVIQLIFTTGWFSSGSKKLLEKSGIIAMDLEQLATFLSDAGVGMDPAGGDFDPLRFRSTLDLV